MSDYPFERQAEQTASQIAGEPPEILHLRKLYREAEARQEQALKDMHSIAFVVNSWMMFRPASEERSDG